jgi:hypothetical protein
MALAAGVARGWWHLHETLYMLLRFSFGVVMLAALGVHIAYLGGAR